MIEDFWKRFPPPIPGFDCLKMKEEIQRKIHEETKNMTEAEILDYFHKGAEKFRRQGRRAVRQGNPLHVKEPPATPYKAKRRTKV